MSDKIRFDVGTENNVTFDESIKTSKEEDSPVEPDPAGKEGRRPAQLSTRKTELHKMLEIIGKPTVVSAPKEKTMSETEEST